MTEWDLAYMRRTLPPLPEPDDYGYYAGNDQGPPWVRQLAYSAEQLRARDFEVARVVLKAAENALINASIEDGYAKVRVGITAATVIVRALEIYND